MSTNRKAPRDEINMELIKYASIKLKKKIHTTTQRYMECRKDTRGMKNFKNLKYTQKRRQKKMLKL
jgi:hypothetical protein